MGRQVKRKKAGMRGASPNSTTRRKRCGNREAAIAGVGEEWSARGTGVFEAKALREEQGYEGGQRKAENTRMAEGKTLRCVGAAVQVEV